MNPLQLSERDLGAIMKLTNRYLASSEFEKGRQAGMADVWEWAEEEVRRSAIKEQSKQDLKRKKGEEQ